ncbi:MAG TPA: type II toxin-antitoxin system prevent-host-death family antitoxin [Thermoanaerobaculia bacterium]|nr:type II toxin-antitoxin system prevent-host-death family antitoxin [Thermoanaerobaculia bacterium]
MTISVTELKARLLEVIREIEQTGTTIEVERHGRVVVRLIPAISARAAGRPWTRLRGSGVLKAAPEESMLSDKDFKALR